MYLFKYESSFNFLYKFMKKLENVFVKLLLKDRINE